MSKRDLDSVRVWLGNYCKEDPDKNFEGEPEFYKGKTSSVRSSTFFVSWRMGHNPFGMVGFEMKHRLTLHQQVGLPPVDF